jgi:hypothetical protein
MIDAKAPPPCSVGDQGSWGFGGASRRARKIPGKVPSWPYEPYKNRWSRYFHLLSTSTSTTYRQLIQGVGCFVGASGRIGQYSGASGAWTTIQVRYKHVATLGRTILTRPFKRARTLQKAQRSAVSTAMCVHCQRTGAALGQIYRDPALRHPGEDRSESGQMAWPE